MLFFIPGAALALLLSRRPRVGGFAWLSLGFGINVLLLTLVTTAAKMAGRQMDATLVIISSAVFLAAAGAGLFLRRSRVEIMNDFPGSPVRCLIAVGALFCLLFFILAGYTHLDPSGYWLIERFSALDFAQPEGKASVPGGALPRLDGAGFVRLEGGRAAVVHANDSPEKKPVDLRLLVESEAPGTFTVSLRGLAQSFSVPQPFIDQGRKVFFQNHSVISCPLELEPGENEIGLRCEGESGGAPPCSYLDFTAMDREAFRRAFLRRCRFANYVLMYDIMETEDFVSNLTVHPYIYHSPGTPEMEGYAVTNPPLSYIFNSFGYVLLGEDMAAINKTAYAVLAALLLASLYHARARGIVTGPVFLGALSLVVVLTMGVSLHFMTHFMFLCVLLSFCFLLERRGGWFFLFAMMSCLSAWAGYYFCVLGLLCYAVLWGEWRWPARQFARVTLGLAAFVVCLLVCGYSRGLLQPWLDILVWENFRRFGTDYLHQAGSPACFLKYALICSGFLLPGLFFGNDRRGRFFLLFSAAYCLTLLVAPSNEWKVHYLPTLVFPVMISASRGLTLAMERGGRGVRPVIAAVWVAALAGFAYVLYLAMRGELVVC